MTKWYQVPNHPNYYVNDQYQVKRVLPNGEESLISALNLRINGEKYRVLPKRLYLLARAGIDPFSAKGKSFDVVEIDGQLKWIEHRDRMKFQADRQLANNTGRFTALDWELLTRWSQAGYQAVQGDSGPLFEVLNSIRSDLNKLLISYRCHSSLLRSEIISEVFTQYAERVIHGRVRSIGIEVLAKMCKQIFFNIKKTRI